MRTLKNHARFPPIFGHYDNQQHCGCEDLHQSRLTTFSFRNKNIDSIPQCVCFKPEQYFFNSYHPKMRSGVYDKHRIWNHLKNYEKKLPKEVSPFSTQQLHGLIKRKYSSNLNSAAREQNKSEWSNFFNLLLFAQEKCVSINRYAPFHMGINLFTMENVKI